jgi:AcrR family transcriptional regulator
MTKTARAPEEVARVRDGILVQALHIIVSEGFPALTMRRLADATRMTATNLYNYFSNKDEIYLYLVIMGFEKLHSQLLDAYRSSDDPIAHGRAMIDAYFRFGLENPQYYDIMFAFPTPRFDDYKGTPLEQVAAQELEAAVKVVELVMQAIREGIPSAAMSRRALQNRLIELWSLLHGMITLRRSRILEYVDPDLDKRYRSVVDELLARVLGTA